MLSSSSLSSLSLSTFRRLLNVDATGGLVTDLGIRLLVDAMGLMVGVGMGKLVSMLIKPFSFHQ